MSRPTSSSSRSSSSVVSLCEVCGEKIDLPPYVATLKYKYGIKCNACEPSEKALLSGWIDVILTVLYNLERIHDGQRYFHWKKQICQYIRHHWNHIFPDGSKNIDDDWECQVRTHIQKHRDLFVSLGSQKWALRLYHATGLPDAESIPAITSKSKATTPLRQSKRRGRGQRKKRHSSYIYDDEDMEDHDDDDDDDDDDVRHLDSNTTDRSEPKAPPPPAAGNKKARGKKKNKAKEKRSRRGGAESRGKASHKRPTTTTSLSPSAKKPALAPKITPKIVQDIFAKRIISGTAEYFIRVSGTLEPFWETRQSMDCPVLLQQFEAICTFIGQPRPTSSNPSSTAPPSPPPPPSSTSTTAMTTATSASTPNSSASSSPQSPIVVDMEARALKIPRGNVCHHCKAVRPRVVCCDNLTLGKCDRKYCERCLEAYYSKSAADILKAAANKTGSGTSVLWECPWCLGFCMCSECLPAGAGMHLPTNEVEKIIASCSSPAGDGQVRYLVKWRNKPMDQASWVGEQGLGASEAARKTFRHALRLRLRGTKRRAMAASSGGGGDGGGASSSSRVKKSKTSAAWPDSPIRRGGTPGLGSSGGAAFSPSSAVHRFKRKATPNRHRSKSSQTPKRGSTPRRRGGHRKTPRKLCTSDYDISGVVLNDAALSVKEIIIPTHRDIFIPTFREVVHLDAPSPRRGGDDHPQEEETSSSEEDTSDEAYARRHLKHEVEFPRKRKYRKAAELELSSSGGFGTPMRRRSWSELASPRKARRRKDGLHQQRGVEHRSPPPPQQPAPDAASEAGDGVLSGALSLGTPSDQRDGGGAAASSITASLNALSSMMSSDGSPPSLGCHANSPSPPPSSSSMVDVNAVLTRQDDWVFASHHHRRRQDDDEEPSAGQTSNDDGECWQSSTTTTTTTEDDDRRHGREEKRQRSKLVASTSTPTPGGGSGAPATTHDGAPPAAAGQGHHGHHHLSRNNDASPDAEPLGNSSPHAVTTRVS